MKTSTTLYAERGQNRGLDRVHRGVSMFPETRDDRPGTVVRESPYWPNVTNRGDRAGAIVQQETERDANLPVPICQ